jgi:5,10-methylenetetrahydromethanopterin reductase
MGLQVELRVPTCAPVTEVADFVRQAEQAGFDGVGLTDMQMLVRDAFVSVAFSTQITSRVRVATAVTNGVTRHISVLANSAQTVSELAPGRVQIWIGRGDSAVFSVGLVPATLNEMREQILTLRSLLAGEKVTFNGTTVRLRHGGNAPPPIYLAADGPKGLALAGEVADGVLARVALHPEVIAETRQHIADGAKRAGRDPREVPLIFCVNGIIRDTMQAARELARPHCVRWLLAGGPLARGLRTAGIRAETLKMPRELTEARPEAVSTLNLYPDLHHAEDWERAKQLCAFLPDEVLARICDTIGFIGTPEHCVNRFHELYRAGLGHFYLCGAYTYEFPRPELEAFKQSIAPAIASLR